MMPFQMTNDLESNLHAKIIFPDFVGAGGIAFSKYIFV